MTHEAPLLDPLPPPRDSLPVLKNDGIEITMARLSMSDAEPQSCTTAASLLGHEDPAIEQWESLPATYEWLEDHMAACISSEDAETQKRVSRLLRGQLSTKQLVGGVMTRETRRIIEAALPTDSVQETEEHTAPTDQQSVSGECPPPGQVAPDYVVSRILAETNFVVSKKSVPELLRRTGLSSEWKLRQKRKELSPVKNKTGRELLESDISVAKALAKVGDARGQINSNLATLMDVTNLSRTSVYRKAKEMREKDVLPTGKVGRAARVPELVAQRLCEQFVDGNLGHDSFTGLVNQTVVQLGASENAVRQQFFSPLSKRGMRRLKRKARYHLHTRAHSHTHARARTSIEWLAVCARPKSLLTTVPRLCKTHAHL
jgi:hypothetical protein